MKGRLVGRRCSALLVLGLGEVRGFWWGFLGDSFFGSTRSSSEHSECGGKWEMWG